MLYDESQYSKDKIMNIVNIADLKAHLSGVIAKIMKTGDPIIIGRYGKPVAKIIPYTETGKKRVLGFGKHLLMTNIPGLQEQVDEPLDPETMDGFYS